MTPNSCIDPNPMIKFEGAEDNASILNYNLPSTTSFKVKNYVTLKIPDHYWLETAIQSPVLNPFDMLQEKPQIYPPRIEAKPRIEGIKERLYIEETKIPDKVNPGDPIVNSLNQPIVNDQILDPTLEELAALVPGLSAFKQFARDLRQENVFLKTGIATNEAQYKSFGNASNSFNQSENTKAYKPVKSTLSAKYGGLTATDVNFHAALGQLTLLKKTLYGNYEPLFVSNPKKVRQKLVLIEEYEIVSFFGDYGAGKTIKTFSLLPGEKTTISIKTNRSSVETKSKTENVLDSYSQESADELETMINEENGESTTETSAEEVGFTSVEENKKSGNASVSGGGSLGIFKASASVSGSISNSDTDTNTSNSNSSRQNATNAITKGMDRHVAQSSAARKTEVNTENQTTSTITESEENSIVRELQNINHSRVLNFAFRELLQEYFTITYLKDVSIGFTQGYPGDGQQEFLSGMPQLLRSVIKPEYVDDVQKAILTELCAVRDFEDNLNVFVGRVVDEIPDFESVIDEIPDPNIQRNPAKTIKRYYFRKRKGLEQEWKGRKVNGIILDTKSRILKTDAIIVEALLGQGEGLDCYNQRLQDAAANRANLENIAKEQAINIIEGIEGSIEKAKMYKSIFGTDPQIIIKDIGDD